MSGTTIASIGAPSGIDRAQVVALHRHLVFSSARLLNPMRNLAEKVDALWWDLTEPHRLIDGPLR